ncbi:unnamed protein product [Phytomonas sp. EM1]|nr:unnamed protein product [Phytomonas sp. EM1]|eukprot:CCW65008.1 unnamed protein product [Phytomonas sp. isolate EM1]
MHPSQSNRHYEGFNYTKGYAEGPPTQGGFLPASESREISASPSFNLAGGSTLVRRGTFHNTASPTSEAGGYGYFHRHSQSLGEYSGFAVSDTGSNLSHPLNNTHHHPSGSGAAQRKGPHGHSIRSPVCVRIGEPSGGGGAEGLSAPLPSPAGVMGEGNPPHSASSSVVNAGAAPLTTSVSFLPPPPVQSHKMIPPPITVSSGGGGVLPEDAARAPQPPQFRPSMPFIPAPIFGAEEADSRLNLAYPPPSQPLPASTSTSAGSLLRNSLKSALGGLLRDLDGAEAGDAPKQPIPLHQLRFGFPEDDLPLLQELGIDLRGIWRRTRVALNPFGKAPRLSTSTSTSTPSVGVGGATVQEATDLAGPLVFAVALALLLSLQGKIQFSAIYSLCVVGVAFFKILLALMHDGGAPLQFIVSCLGYALMPNLLLAALRTLQVWIFGTFTHLLLPFAWVVILWSSWCATKLLVEGLSMQPQRYLILYPMSLFYAVFAVLTIF